MTATTITLPWPPTCLSPNSRMHWAPLAKAKARYRQACRLATIEQQVRLPGDSWDVLLVFLPPTRRRYDRDNLQARMKAGLDGVCDALGIDDSKFVRVASEVGGWATDAHVELTLTPRAT